MLNVVFYSLIVDLRAEATGDWVQCVLASTGYACIEISLCSPPYFRRAEDESQSSSG